MNTVSLPEGSTLHATALPKWVKVVLNISLDDRRAFDAYLAEQFVASPRQWRDFPQWLMHEDSFLDFCVQWQSWSMLEKVAA